MLSFSMSKQTNCGYYAGYLLLFMLWVYTSFPVRKVRSVFGRFLEGLKPHLFMVDVYLSHQLHFILMYLILIPFLA